MAQPTYEQLLNVIAQKDRQIAQLEARVCQLQKWNTQLEVRNAELERRNAELELRNAGLEARVAQLEQLVDKTTRAGKRQAAPFSKGGPKKNPNKPGRKSGNKYGPKAHRPVPAQEPNEVIDVPLAKHCDECGGFVQEDHIDQQYQVEIPVSPSFGASTSTSGSANNVADAFRRGTSCRPPTPAGQPRRSWAPICRR